MMKFIFIVVMCLASTVVYAQVGPFNNVGLFGGAGIVPTCPYQYQSLLDFHPAVNPWMRFDYGPCINGPRPAGKIGFVTVPGFLTALSQTNDMVITNNDSANHIRIANNTQGKNIYMDLYYNAAMRTRLTAYDDGKFDFNVGNWNCNTGVVRLDGEPWNGTLPNVDDPVIKLYRPTGTVTTCPIPDSWVWAIQNSGSGSGTAYTGALQFRTSLSQWPIGTEPLLTARMTILRDGNVGINTTVPVAKLQVDDGSVLFQGTTGVTPTSGSGSRLMWIPSKYAFRAGFAGSTSWNAASIGDYSWAGGIGTEANASSSFAFGSGVTVSGAQSVAFGNGCTIHATSPTSLVYGNQCETYNIAAIAGGYGCIAYGYADVCLGFANVTGDLAHSPNHGNVALGHNCRAKAQDALAMGFDAEATGDFSIAAGHTVVASANDAVGIGREVTSSGQDAIAIGHETDATATDAFAIGHGVTSSGQDAIAIGHEADATATDAFAIGHEVTSSGQDAVAIGHETDATATDAIAIGHDANATAPHTFAIGHEVLASADDAVAMGYKSVASEINAYAHGFMVENSGIRAILFGCGHGAAPMLTLVNEESDKFKVGFRSDSSTLIVTSGNGMTGSFGNVGVAISNPDNRFEVRGGAVIGSTFAGNVSPALVGDGLYVEGPVSINSNITTGIYELYVAGAALSTVSWTISDSNTKSNVQLYDTGLDAIRKINTVSYQFKPEYSSDTEHRYVGALAQELAEIIPNAVRVDTVTATSTRYAVNSDGVLYTLVNAVQELDSTVASMKNELNLCSSSHSALDSAIQVLKEENKTLMNMYKELMARSATTQEVPAGPQVLLEQNRPNPVTGSTEIVYWIPETVQGNVVLEISEVGSTSVVHTVQVSKGSMGKELVNAGSWKRGAYVYCLKADQRVLACKKFLVTN